MEMLAAAWHHVLGSPGPSGFGSASTAEDVAQRYADRVAGKVAIVTGATSGIGKETARVLARHGATVFVCARTQDKGDALVRELLAELPSARLRVLVMDMEALASVHGAAAAFKREGVPLNILVNNAGVMYTPDAARTADGLEMQFGVNHLAHFVFTELLMDELRAGRPSRVVNVSSLAQWALAPSSGVDFDVDSLKQRNSRERYGISKLANALHAQDITRRHAAEGVTAYALHPGNIYTPLMRHVLPSFLNDSALVKSLSRLVPVLKTVEQGAATQVYCALAPDAEPGFYNDCNVDRVFVHAQLADPTAAARLHALSCELGGLPAPK